MEILGHRNNIVLLVSILCLGTSMCVALTAGAAKTMKLPRDAKSILSHPQPQFSIPPKQASVDPETVKELVEFQEIVTEGVPLLLKLFNKLMKNKFAKPLLEVLLTCDKQNFMVSCVQGIFQKMVGILTGQAKQAQPGGSGGAKKGHEPHMKQNQAHPNKNDEGDNVKNLPRDDHNNNDDQAKSEENQATGDSDKVKLEYQSEVSDEKVKENKTQPAKDQRPHAPIGPTSADHKSEL